MKMMVTWGKKEIQNPVLRGIVVICLGFLAGILMIVTFGIFLPFALLWKAIGNPFNLIKINQIDS